MAINKYPEKDKVDKRKKIFLPVVAEGQNCGLNRNLAISYYTAPIRRATNG